MSWKDEIQNALAHLGGEAPLQEIYDYVEKSVKGSLSTNWTATIRGTLERFSSDSKAFSGKEDIFYSVHGVGSGVWGLRDFIPTRENMDLTQDDAAFSEGRPLLKSHILRERNHQVISKAKERFLKIHGSLYWKYVASILRKCMDLLGKILLKDTILNQYRKCRKMKKHRWKISCFSVPTVTA